MSSEDLTPTDAAVVTTLVSGLSAYGRLYGLPNSPEQVQGILGYLLRLYRPQMPVALVDVWAQQVLDGLTPDDLTQAIVSRATSALAKAARRWQQHLEQRVESILAAYVQIYRPALTPETLKTAITAALPLLGACPYGSDTDPRPLTRAEVMGLISHLGQIFDPGRAIASEIAPGSRLLAATLAKALDQQPMTQAVKATVTAYVHQHAPALPPIGVDLIAAALVAVRRNQIDFNLDPQLTVIDEALLIEQVSFQLNLLPPSPLPSKAADAIAEQLNAAVEQCRQDRNNRAAVNVTAGLISGDGLSISSPLTSSRRLGDRADSTRLE
ncbi:MAG: hypothetical protein EA368_14050 [Leptolyngbya sp. DLM2.Bin27]|nr:MAG: hypothetical protein EA368_14050 [Leptolyngbya sp. DLM2.Bin27]